MQTEVDLMKLGAGEKTDVLKRLRKSSGLTQREVAEVLGITEQGYAMIESGERKLGAARLMLLIEYYDLPFPKEYIYNYVSGELMAWKDKHERKKLEAKNG